MRAPRQPALPVGAPSAAATDFLRTTAQLAAAIANAAPLAWVALADRPAPTAWAPAGSPLAGLALAPALLRAALEAAQPTEIFPERAGLDFPALRAGLRQTAGVRQCNTQPLRSPTGHLLGVLAVYHTTPTPLSAAQQAQLTLLAQQTATFLDYLGQAAALPPPAPAASGPAPALLPEPTTLFVKQEQRLQRLLQADIYCVEALGDYVNIYTTTARLTVYTTMKEMELKLPRGAFARVHRKYIARLDRILLLEGDGLQLDTGRALAPMEVPVGNSYKAGLLGRLNVV